MKRVSWKRGMRLTEELLRASDICTLDTIREVALLSSGGMIGLIPSEQPFEISVNFGKGCLDIDTLSCRAISRDGTLIDAHFNTRFDNNYNTRINIPELPGADEYLLVVCANPSQWKVNSEGLEEPVYTFSLIGTDTIVPDNAVPVARIVDDYGWRVDEVDFVPPCIIAAVHPKYNEQIRRFEDLLAAMDLKAKAAIGSAAHSAVSVFWPLVMQLRIELDKRREIISPMELMGEIQRCVSAFTCACELNPALVIPELKMFRSYVLAPFTVKDAYTRIKIGLEICGVIIEKVSEWAGMAAPRPEPKPVAATTAVAAPTIDAKYMQIICNTSESTIPINYSQASASVHFTIDGTVPSKSSPMASRLRSGFRIKFDNGFRAENHNLVEKTMVINLIAYDGSEASNVSSYRINLKKDVKFRNAIPI